MYRTLQRLKLYLLSHIFLSNYCILQSCRGDWFRFSDFARVALLISPACCCDGDNCCWTLRKSKCYHTDCRMTRWFLLAASRRKLIWRNPSRCLEHIVSSGLGSNGPSHLFASYAVSLASARSNPND
ncbi:hypothetical protein GE09DRAFT_202228 [Coniochaeta sp. 2T2.1]|nr:hypothetical protein GE09DRAFT_202228 [Coniochaeta sp. 2T2.1]